MPGLTDDPKGRSDWSARAVGVVIMIVLLMVSGTVTGRQARDSSLPLHVMFLTPEPNYPLTHDRGDAGQLTDGVFNRFPIWTKRDSVTWQQRSPVRIVLRAPMRASGSYQLQLRSGRGAAAKVYPPRRVDVYCGAGPSRAAVHVGSSVLQRPADGDDGVVELAVPFVGCEGGVLQVVLHASGRYMAIDEITVQPSPAASPGPDVGYVDERGVRDVLKDSRERLSNELADQARDRLRRQLAVGGKEGSDAWLAAPWGDLQTPDGDERITITSLPGSPSAFVLGIANRTGQPKRYSLRLDPALTGRATISRLQPVLAADGSMAFDALRPVSKQSWQIGSNQLLYLFVQIISDVQAGEWQVRVSDDFGWSRTLTVELEHLDGIRPKADDKPNVFVWAYTSDRPIWHLVNTQTLAGELVKAGVNVFIIPPSHIPMPSLTDQKDGKKRVKGLVADVDLFRDKGLILLFTGGRLWDAIKNGLDRPGIRRELQNWASMLVRTMREQGVPPERWAMYPVDEPRNGDLEQLGTLIELLREQEPDLRFYVDPIIGRRDQTLQPETVSRLGPLIDYWQPRAGAAYKRVRYALPGTDQIWMYDNPCEPAKATAPAWYRALPIRAFDTGAAGVGFWSFSAANKSSAWSDLDGYRPDWSVVYESDEGFVSSRRWEAFKMGVKEFAALKFCARRSDEDAELEKQCGQLRQSLPITDLACHRWP